MRGMRSEDQDSRGCWGESSMVDFRCCVWVRDLEREGRVHRERILQREVEFIGDPGGGSPYNRKGARSKRC